MWNDKAQEMATLRIVTVWAPTRPMTRPNNPARIAPISGAKGINTSSVRFMLASASQRIHIFNVDAATLAEQHHENGQPDRRFGGCHRQHEKHEHLAMDVTQVA